jgi:hypothetical protein
MEERQHFLQKDRLMAGRTFDGGGRHWGAGSRPDDSFPAMAQVKFFLNDCMILSDWSGRELRRVRQPRSAGQQHR